jgi:acetoin utilization deacetylase AcuC-like enzyme
MDIVTSEKFLDHPGNELEGAYRIQSFLKDKSVKKKNINGEKYLSLAHSSSYIKRVKYASENNQIIAEVGLSNESYQTACFAVGLTIHASQKGSFVIVRPPGHHAGKSKASGFCLFNNIAIAVQKLLDEGKKVAILDLDGHHGNGTESIFKEKRNVYYFSTHQSHAYPGTGIFSEKNIVNIPLRAPVSESEYLKALDHVLSKIKPLKIDILAISVGFDTFKDDKLLNFNLNITSYKKIGKEISKHFKNLFAVLEGGYHSKIKECSKSFVEGINLKH